MPCARWCCDLRRPCACFNLTLFFKNMSRFWPIWVLYGVIWFLILPVGILNGQSSWIFSTSVYPHSAKALQIFLVSAIRAGVYLNPLFGILAAMAVFSYLCSPRACGMIHALPIRREGLFLTNYLSGLSFFLLPILVVALLTLAAQLYVAGTVKLTALFLWAWCQALMALFFFSLGAFCAMLTGHLLALPAFYGGLNLLALGFFGLYQQTASRLLFGYVTSPAAADWVEWLTPVLCYSRSLGCSGSPDYRLTGLLSVFVYGFAGVVLAAAALLLYRRRALESAGDLVVLPWLRPVFRWCIALFTAVYLGSFLQDVLFPHRRDAVLLLGCCLFTGALGYFVSEMLLRKSFRVLRKSWRGCVCFLGLFLLGFGMLALDVAGYEVHVPAPDTVASLTIQTNSLAPYDDAGAQGDISVSDLAAGTALHQSVVDRRRELEYAPSTYLWDTVSRNGQPLDIEVESTCYLSFSYTLKDGSVLRRSYNIPVSPQLLSHTDTPAARLNALLNTPEQMEAIYFRSYQEGDTLAGAYLSAPAAEDGLSFGSQELELLYQAVRTDLAAGRLGRHYLLEDLERMETCYFNDLTFTFYPTAPRKGQLHRQDGSYTITITLQTTATETLRVLSELGAADGLVLKADSPY